MCGMNLIDETPVDPGNEWVADHVRRYVESGGADGGEFAPGVPVLLLTTRGRRSGTVRRTPLVFGRDGDDYIVVASFNGAPKDPDWFVNLAADPEVVVQVGPEVMPGTARVAGAAERERLWARMTAISPGYEDAAAKAGRQIPVVVISTQ